MSKLIRKTKKINGKQYAAYGKTEIEAMTKLAEKIAAVKLTAWPSSWVSDFLGGGSIAKI